MKKVLSLVLVLTMVLGSFSFAFAAAPSDVAGTEYEEAVTRLASLGVLEGYPDGTFKPGNTITRAEFAAAVVKIKGLKSAADASKGATSFGDVPASHWATGYVNIASKMGFVKGMGDGTFAPSAPITYEQAVTLVVRALGYEAAANARGGYPYGYLVVATQEGLTDGVNGVQGIPAPRGLVAQLLDNALEIPMMIQVGYGDQTKWVKSGTEDTKEIFLLDDLGFEKVEKERVVSIDKDKNTIKFEEYGKVDVVDGFDFEEVYGVRLNAWLNSDGEVVIYTLKDTPKFDATTGGEKIKLLGENKKYEVAKGADLVLDGEEVKAEKFVADYAKIVLNSDDEIVWAYGFNWDDTFAAKEVKDEVVYSYDEDDLDLEDYTIVKDGKTLLADDIEEGDILFFNKGEEYAVVYNDSKTGELERVYDESFKFDGDTYENSNANYEVKYVDGDVVGKVDKDILSGMKDEGDVTIFFDFAGEAVFVMGDRGEANTNYYYGVVTADSEYFKDRNVESYTFDVLNEEGKVVKYDVAQDDIEDTDFFKDGLSVWKSDIDKDAVVKVTVDEDGDLTEIELLTGKNVTDVKIDAAYAGGYKLQDDAVVFIAEGETAVKDYDVIKWSEAEDKFTKVETGIVYAGSKARVEAIFVTKTDADTEDHMGLVTDVRKVKTSKDVWDITIEIAGEEKSFLTDGTLKASDITGISNMDDLEDKFVVITVTDTEKIKAIDAQLNKLTGLKIDDISTTNDSITVGKSVYYLTDNAVVYDTDLSDIDLRDLDEKDTITIYFLDDETTEFVSYVQRTALVDEDDSDDEDEGKLTGTVSFVTTARGNVWVTIDDVNYLYNGAESEVKPLEGKEVTFEFVTIDGDKVIKSIVEKK
ncbi:S-layer homology domain-containing protein [Brassicibacter mesophilus]|uniref:S-layer homology domain-containing protein n=1 Tax=Brassicibacter mesophilus TaxID=745119 RepID=UPI003D251A32